MAMATGPAAVPSTEAAAATATASSAAAVAAARSAAVVAAAAAATPPRLRADLVMQLFGLPGCWEKAVASGQEVYVTTKSGQRWHAERECNAIRGREVRSYRLRDGYLEQV